MNCCLLNCFQVSKTINTMRICLSSKILPSSNMLPSRNRNSSEVDFILKNLWKWNKHRPTICPNFELGHVFLRKSGQTQPFKAKATFHFHSVSRSLSRQHCQDARQWKTTQHPRTKQEHVKNFRRRRSSELQYKVQRDCREKGHMWERPSGSWRFQYTVSSLWPVSTCKTWSANPWRLGQPATIPPSHQSIKTQKGAPKRWKKQRERSSQRDPERSRTRASSHWESRYL